MSFVKIENLKYRYPLKDELALDGINVKIKKGSFIGVIGSNNAGKSSLCYALSGIIPHFYKGAYGGKVMIGESEVKETSVAELSERVGIIFQNPFNQITGSKITVYEEVAFGLENLGIPREEMVKRIDEALKMLNIYEYKDRNPFSLSGGQMQRLAIASIIAMQPELIILDEPTSQLDPKGSSEVFDAIDMLSQQGITIMMVEHKMEKLVEYADEIILLDKGKLIAMDTPEAIFSRDDISNYGIDVPIFTEVARHLNMRDANGQFPVNITETIQLFNERKRGL